MTRGRTAATVAATEAAADALLGWLRTQPTADAAIGTDAPKILPPADGTAPASIEPAAAPPPAEAFLAAPPTPSSEAPDVPAKSLRDETGAKLAAPLARPNPDWLHHRLRVTGPAGAVAALRQKAAGAGTIPWQLDFDRLQEDWFHRLAAPPAPQRRRLSLHGARALAEQLRDAAERRHALAVARVGSSTACPFDLHALLPVPAAVRALGPDHPDALHWLWRHWGTTQALRHVAEVRTPKTPPAGQAEWQLRFWSADWTPWRAFLTLQTLWPALRFEIRPSYGAA